MCRVKRGAKETASSMATLEAVAELLILRRAAIRLIDGEFDDARQAMDDMTVLITIDDVRRQIMSL
jgi:hypothetical protein